MEQHGGAVPDVGAVELAARLVHEHHAERAPRVQLLLVRVPPVLLRRRAVWKRSGKRKEGWKEGRKEEKEEKVSRQGVMLYLAGQEVSV